MTLDSDVAAELKRGGERARRLVQTGAQRRVRAGLRPAAEPRRYQLRTFSLGLRSGVDVDKALALAANLQDDEVVRKLELR